MRIVSLVPSITETLFDFGLSSKNVVGRTKFCIHPQTMVNEIPTIGGTKNLNIEKIRSLKPDLILANKEENEKLQVEELMKEFKVWITDISTFKDNDVFLRDLGKMLQQESLAEKMIQKIHQNFLETPLQKKAAYLIWKNPYMTVGSDTFIHQVLEKLGFENIFRDRKRYPEINVEVMREAEFVLLSSEPYPFKEKHIAELQQKLPDAKILMVDGEAFSWFGSHLSNCGDYFRRMRELLSEN